MKLSLPQLAKSYTSRHSRTSSFYSVYQRRYKTKQQHTKTNSSFFKRRSFLKGAIGVVAALSPLSFFGCHKHYTPVAPYYRPRYHTIAHDILEIEMTQQDQLALIDNYILLDTLIDEVLLKVSAVHGLSDPSREAVARTFLSAFNAELRKCGYTYERNGTLSKGLKLRGINCDCSSAIYMAIGEILNLPIMLTRAPSHAFVRWHFNKRNYINWETTIGQPKQDAYYIRTHKISTVSIGVSALRSLDVHKNRQNILANAYTNSGVQSLKDCNLKMAKERFRYAIKSDPLYDAPYFNLGLTHFKLGNNEEAVFWCKGALRLNPNHVRAHAVMNIAYGELGNKRLAKYHRKAVKRLNSTYYSLAERKKRRANVTVCTF